MDLLTRIKTMTKSKKEEEIVLEAPVIPTSIAKLPVDYGREDLNNMAKTINEIIDRIS